MEPSLIDPAGSLRDTTGRKHRLDQRRPSRSSVPAASDMSVAIRRIEADVFNFDT
jgi:hypothetical protein